MTSGATTLETLKYSRIAGKLGYDAQQVIPPYYWRCGELEVERHFRMIAEAGDLPVVIYHNPALSKFNISPKFAGKLATIAGVVAFKEVLTDLQHLEALYDEVGGRADIYNTFRALLAGLMLGAAGGFINIFAVPAAVALMRWFKCGRPRDAPRKFSAGSIDASRAAARRLSVISAPRKSPRRSSPASRWARRGHPTWRPRMRRSGS